MISLPIFADTASKIPSFLIVTFPEGSRLSPVLNLALTVYWLDGALPNPCGIAKNLKNLYL